MSELTGKTNITNLCKTMSTIPTSVVFILSLLIVAITGIIDYKTNNSISLSAFYVFPIAFLAWHSQKSIVLVFTIIAAIIRSEIIIYFIDKAFIDLGICIWNFLISLLLYIPTGLIIIRLKQAYCKEKELARIDFVTGISNWNSFSEAIIRENERCKRYKIPLSIVYLDCDNFKILNDTKGHTSGDNSLKLVARTINDNIRKLDLVARLGGDEFAIILSNAGQEEACLVVNKIKKILLTKMQENNYPITFSIGIATFVNPHESAEEMLQLADQLMYEVKRESKNAIKQKVY
ncbi:MAG: GGDEF domain-containing protein [Cyanobacteriota bacterium]